MQVNVIMPKMGESINEGTIIKWNKKVGEIVKKDEIIFEISTDKVDTEIPSPAEGVLFEIKVFEQETVVVDTVVAIIETDINIPVKIQEVKVSGNPKAELDEMPSTKQVGGNLIDIPMPKMGESVMEGTIIKWNKKVGETVKKDEILFEISTDKVDTEVPSPEDGTLSEILVAEQQTVLVGTIVARLSSRSGLNKTNEQKTESTKTDFVESPALSESNAMVIESFEMSSPSSYKNKPGRKFYSPLVLSIAQKENISFEELENIPGSGIEGRITKKDILKYLENLKIKKSEKPVSKIDEQPKVLKPVATSIQWKEGQDIVTIPMDNIRQKIMKHMVNSKDTSVHVTAVIEVDMNRIHNFIKNNKEDFLKRENLKLTYLPFIAYACIKALKEYPFMNASVDGTNIILKKHINLGFAVAMEPNGLIVPNIKNADDKNVKGLARSIAETSEKARSKKLTVDDISGGTFTITNYGVFGTLFGTPIINQPEVAVLGVGTVTKKPIVMEVDGTDTISVRPMMYLSLSHDHRLVDGMLGGRFLKTIKDSLENFEATQI
ncbi:MAG: 2-oxoglutarate dehydrogenase, E2 component, dihydrolipoamide succinyltransferase [Ignavibacteriales bacterium]|nr:2-oxoglutarate dehydrogenase, E2 component, dihydrolipoamide succinyltransferase [Ignavibacteriales bacterium]